MSTESDIYTCTCSHVYTHSGLIYYYAALSHALKEVNKDLRLQLRVVILTIRHLDLHMYIQSTHVHTR